MTDEANTADGDDEYRPTDCLATCELSWGIGYDEDAAIINALRYAGPWEDRDEPLTVQVWELYADSWTSHSPSGPERSAEWLAFTRYEITVEEANEVSDKGSKVNAALDRALADGEVIEEKTPEAVE